MIRLPSFRAPLLVLAILAAPSAAAAEAGDILVQAGHEGRPASCTVHHVKACNIGTGALGAHERDWTALVADEATRVLRARGYAVLRRPADYDGGDTVRAAVFLHFDGSATPCGSGASVGFPDATPHAFVAAWESRYRAWFPFRFVGENFTTHEHHYYGFRKVDAPQKLLIEFGEMTCPAQFAWMAPRLGEMGDRLAAFLIEQVPR